MSDDILPPAIGKPCEHLNRRECPRGKYTCQDCGAEGYMMPARIQWESPSASGMSESEERDEPIRLHQGRSKTRDHY